MKRVLCVGVATWDIVNRVRCYPAEDSKIRALSQVCRVGGNAANTAIALRQLGARVSWVGNLAGGDGRIEEDLRRFGVDVSLACRIDGAQVPSSYITLSEESGSRSVVHHRDLPEYRAADFSVIDLWDFDWVHFEGRAIDQLPPMLRQVRSVRGLPASLEVEKPRPGIEDLFSRADLLMFSSEYALQKGFADAATLLNSLPEGVVATCAWGEQGAWALDRDRSILHAAAPRLDSAVDTLGAGDVFNAAMVHGLGTGRPLGQVLAYAVETASRKCTRTGLDLDLGRATGSADGGDRPA